jgi:hypothetical protein
VTAFAFELDISLGEVSKVQVGRIDAPKLDAGTWFVRYDDGVVTVHALAGGKVHEIARASWLREHLLDRTSVKPGTPSDREWKRVATAVSRVLRRTASAMPAWRRAIAAIDPKSRRVIIGSIIMGVLAIGATVAIFVIRTNEPAAESLAPLDSLSWTDLQRGGETTVPLILKDPERERGRKLCVEGTVVSIERARVNGRDAHVGAMRIGDDGIDFIALGSTGSIVARSSARMCGVGHGKRILGRFDLPENRN